MGQAVGQEKEFKNSFTNITRPIFQKKYFYKIVLQPKSGSKDRQKMMDLINFEIKVIRYDHQANDKILYSKPA